MILLLAVILAVVWWFACHPYVVTSREMERALRLVIQSDMPWEKWRTLLYRRISRDRYLESVRSRLAELPITAEPSGRGLLYAPVELEKIARILQELQKKRSYALENRGEAKPAEPGATDNPDDAQRI